MRKTLLVLLLSLCCCYALAQQYRIGDTYTAPDGSKGIVFHVFPNGVGGLAVALEDVSTSCAWGNNSDVPNLTNHPQNNSVQSLIHDTTGYANTLAIRTHQGNSAYAAGLVDFNNGWVLPSPSQLSILYGMKNIINRFITSAGGNSISNDSYWSSGECSSSQAWLVNFSTGQYVCARKDTLCHARAIHYFDNVNPAYSYFTYSWSTGSNQPIITVSPPSTSSYTVTVTTPYGCSSTATQDILVGTGNYQVFYDDVCQNAPYEGYGFAIPATETSTPGRIWRVRRTEVVGCSDLITLELTIKPNYSIDML